MKSLSALIHDEVFRSVLLVIVGFVLAQLNSLFADRKERKKAVSCALSDLLEVRYQFIGLEDLVEQIEMLTGSNIPEHQKSQIRVVFDSLFPAWNELHARYERSVSTLAGMDPVLAFRLRAKDFIRPAFTAMHSMIGQDAQAAAVVGPIIRTQLHAKLEPVLNESILTLARKKSLLCWYETHRLLKKQRKHVQKEMMEIMQPLKVAMDGPLKAIVEAQKKSSPEAQQKATGHAQPNVSEAASKANAHKAP